MPNFYGLVGPPSSNPDGTNVQAMQGRAGEVAVADLHGKFYTAAYRNRVFVGSTTTAGTTIPIYSTTTTTFCLYNPLGSGVNMEMISADVAVTTTTAVATAIQLGLISGLTVGPTTTTALTPVCSLLGGTGVAQAKLYSSAVVAAAATSFFPLFGISTTTGALPLLHYDFDGKIVLAPGSLVYLAGTLAQTQPTVNAFVWAEFPT